MNTKTSLTKNSPLTIALTALTALTLVKAPFARAADDKSVVKSAPGLPAPRGSDPSSGLPVAWKDPNWPDPDKQLAEVTYDGLPVREVARHLREQFKDAFDTLIPNTWQHPNNPSITLDPQSLAISMQLKNVTASEVFNAMNLLFEGENTPCRWELRLNGKRPTAVLRVIPELFPALPDSPPPQPTTRLVYFVGDLIEDEKHRGMSMEQLVETVSQVYEMSYGQSKGVLQFHKGAQLIIAHGTSDQIGFVQQTLAALRGKLQADQRSQSKSAEKKNP